MSAVIAGCGDLGTEIGLRLAGLGHEVVGLRRRAELVPPPLTGVSVDLSTEVPELPGDVDLLVVATAADERTPEAYEAAYVDSLRHVFDGVRAAGSLPRRALLISSTAVCGSGDGEVVTEDTPPDPVTPTARVLLEAEDLFHEQFPYGTVLRLSGLYGPGRTRLIDKVRSGDAAGGAAWTNRIHRDDAAAAAVHLLTMADQPLTLYLGTDDRPVPEREVLEFVAQELGVPLPEDVPEADSPPRGAKRLSNARLRESGFEFRYPTYREGYRAVLAGEGSRHS
ncbi:SDR family oxidoreductase [Kocuria sp. M1R5S2]|uniref:SDR family oxidoreductase n=1 Tax=Kocuria rhizosphaerae TaxID=3376285 RepID=UPI0037B82AE2